MERTRFGIWLALALPLAACGGAGSEPSRPAARGISGDGIVQYDGYIAARARDGETVIDVARRIGAEPTALAAYNGLSPTHRLRGGDELVIPPAG